MNKTSCPTCGCDTYNETGRCESALQLDKKNVCIEKLVNLLRPFATLLGKHMARERDSKPVFAVNDAIITIGDLRKACDLIVKIDKESQT